MRELNYQNFETLAVWREARVLKNEIFILVKTFPAEEKYKLTDQLLRSSRSVNAQIAEGHGKRTNPDKIKFCLQARGSLSETLSHMIDAFDCGYIKSDQLHHFREMIKKVERILNGYIAWLERQDPPK
jgi:four helix bundle protein